MANVVERTAIFCISLFYGFLVLLEILWNIVRRPSVLCKVKHPMPACLANPDLGEHNYLRTASGLRFHYVAKGDPAKPLMLFVHGYPEFWYSWRHQIRAFASSYRVAAVDMRGYGESDKPEGKEMYKMPLLVKDLKEIIDSLGYSSCVLVCHDYGAFIAWVFTHQYPEYVSKLIAMNGPHPIPARRHGENSKTQLRKTWYVYFFQLPLLPELFVSFDDYGWWFMSLLMTEKSDGRPYVGDREEDMEAFKYTYSQPGALTSPINYYRWVFDFVVPPEVYTRKIEAPTLIIWGINDVALEREILHGTDEFVTNLTVRYVEGASHFVQQDEPAIVNQLMEEFLSSCSSPEVMVGGPY